MIMKRMLDFDNEQDAQHRNEVLFKKQKFVNLDDAVLHENMDRTFVNILEEPACTPKCTGSSKKPFRTLSQIKVVTYMNYGLLTVHVIQGRHLSSKWSSQANSCVMVSLIPDVTNTSRCRTDIIPETNNPTYDEKFSFELGEEDLVKRMLVSVWHKDNKSGLMEFLGCTSFGLAHLTKPEKKVDGWYYLLTEEVGRKKHLQVATKIRSTEGPQIPVVNKNIREAEELVITVHRGKQGFGFTLAESCPVKVGRVDGGSQAERAGVQKGDIVVRVNGQNVSRSTAVSVAKLVKLSGSMVALEINRPRQMIGQSAEHKGDDSDTDDSGNASIHDYSFHDDRARLLNTGTSREARRQAAIITLLSMEESFVEMMHQGMQRFSRPLRHCILSTSQHASLFQNIEKLVSISEYQSRQIRDNRPSCTDDEADASFNEGDDFIAAISMIYGSKINMLSQAYSLYVEGLPMATRILAHLEMSTDFRNFMMAQPSKGRQLSLSSFINRPLRHLQDIHSVFQTMVSNTTAMSPLHSSFTMVIKGLQSCLDRISALDTAPVLRHHHSNQTPSRCQRSLKHYGSGSSSGASSSSGFGSRGSRHSDIPSCPAETDGLIDREAELRRYAWI